MNTTQNSSTAAIGVLLLLTCGCEKTARETPAIATQQQGQQDSPDETQARSGGAGADNPFTKAFAEQARGDLPDLVKQNRIPDLPPLFLKPGQRWDADGAITRSTPEAIRIDKEDWVVLWAAVPTVTEGTKGMGKVALKPPKSSFST